MNIVKKRQVQYSDVSKKIASGNLKKKSWPELKKLFIKFDKLHLDFFIGPVWIPFVTEPMISAAAEKELKKLVKLRKQSDKYMEYFDVIFSPEQKNAIVMEHLDLLRIALRYKTRNNSRRQLNKLIDLHTKKYEWLPCYDINDKPWTKQYIIKELNKLLKRNPKYLSAEIKEINQTFKYHQENFNKILRKLRPSARQRELFIMAHDMSFIKDERDDYRRMGSFYIQPLYHEIGRRVGLTIQEITQLIRSETLELLNTKKLPIPRAVVNSRTKGYILLRKYGQPVIVSQGQAIKKIVKRELGSGTIVKEKVLMGLVGSTGKAKGRVQVIYTKHDLRKVKQGEVMVAVTTHPDFVPAMRKCKAIITDEGGLTCHAAIVARELKIPCVVGTKIATKIFKDGDVVEVDAINGIVRKI
ncbi:hypothetical protein KKF61_03195 [Patescibacteria group bacterium]|nr:hypothetical protein [Patescibacteria group bacterium]MBU0964250.1 hypothetical protein [Patescibacteria group bacterium]